MTSAAVGPSVVSTSQPRADSASWRPIATRAWSSTIEHPCRSWTTGAGSAARTTCHRRGGSGRRSTRPARPSPGGRCTGRAPNHRCPRRARHARTRGRGSSRGCPAPVLDEDRGDIASAIGPHVDRRPGSVLAGVVQQGHHDLRRAVRSSLHHDAPRQRGHDVQAGPPGAGDHRRDRVTEIETWSARRRAHPPVPSPGGSPRPGPRRAHPPAARSTGHGAGSVLRPTLRSRTAPHATRGRAPPVGPSAEVRVAGHQRQALGPQRARSVGSLPQSSSRAHDGRGRPHDRCYPWVTSSTSPATRYSSPVSGKPRVVPGPWSRDQGPASAGAAGTGAGFEREPNTLPCAGLACLASYRDGHHPPEDRMHEGQTQLGRRAKARRALTRNIPTLASGDVSTVGPRHAEP